MDKAMEQQRMDKAMETQRHRCRNHDLSNMHRGRHCYHHFRDEVRDLG